MFSGKKLIFIGQKWRGGKDETPQFALFRVNCTKLRHHNAGERKGELRNITQEEVRENL